MHLQILGYSDTDCARKIIEICDLPVSVKEYANEVKKHIYLLKDTKLLPGKKYVIHLIYNLTSFKLYVNIHISNVYTIIKLR